MFKKLKLSFLGALMTAGLVGGVVAATIPTANTSAASCGQFLTFPAWYKGLTDSNCEIQKPTQTEEGFTKFIWGIALNIFEILLQLIGYVATFFIIYGGFIYLTSAGSPERASQGMKTILNAVIGLVIGFGAVAIKNLIWSIVIGSPNEYGVYVSSGEEILRQALNTTYTIAGIIAVAVIIISGISYASSSGNPGAVTRAKNMLMYGVIGLVVVIAAFAITSFVAGRF